jgi:heat shock transcription factor
MQKPVPSRKRPAPGASPLVQQPMTPQTAFHYQQMPENADFSVDLPTAFKTDEPYFDAAFNDPNVFAAALNATHSPTFGSGTAPTPTTDLVRRARNHQLAPQNNPQEVWDGGNVGGMNGKAKDEEEEEDLNLKVALAKSEAQGKRKQIPPFVQKLSRLVPVVQQQTRGRPMLT